MKRGFTHKIRVGTQMLLDPAAQLRQFAVFLSGFSGTTTLPASFYAIETVNQFRGEMRELLNCLADKAFARIEISRPFEVSIGYGAPSGKLTFYSASDALLLARLGAIALLGTRDSEIARCAYSKCARGFD